MPNITTKTFDQLVSDQVTAIQSEYQSRPGSTVIRLLDFAVGSVLRSVVESNAAVVLWIQGLLLSLLSSTRAATSSGADLDSWALDYNFTRLPAVAATGDVTFSRFSADFQAVVPPGTQVQTSDASPEIFTVTMNTSNIYWSSTLNGYVAALGVNAITVPVQCTTAGTAGNILAGECNVLTGSLPGIDAVTNAGPFTNGIDAETDTAFRARFVDYLGSLSKATKSAISAAVAGVQQGLNFTVTENYDYAGTPMPGHFFVVVDDGSGTPSSTLLASVSNAIDAVRGFSTTFTVHPPVLQTASVAMTITSTNQAADAVLAQAAISGYIAGLGVGASLPYSRLAQLAYDASPTITNVTAVTLNGGTGDVISDDKQRIVSGSIVVN